MVKKNRSKPDSSSKAKPPGSAAAVDVAAQSIGVRQDEAPASGPITRWRGAYAIIPAALAFLASVNTLWNGFASDDTQQILNNAFIKSLRNLPLAFTSSVWSYTSLDISMTAQPYYRPMFSALFTVNYALFDTLAWAWHLVNVLIHVAVTILVYVVCKELAGKKRLAAIAASLFAVHPVHAESVAWISGVTDPLAALFLLPAFYCYLRYKRTGRRSLIAAVLVLYLLALWSKETAIALPLVIAYCEMFHFTESAPLRQRIIRLSALAVLFAVPTIFYLLTRLNAMGTLATQDELRYPVEAILKTIPLVIVKYLTLLTVPLGYSYQHYTPHVTSFGSLGFLLPLLFLAALAVGLVLIRSRVLRFAVVWFIAFLAPALAALRNFDPEYLVQERYLYLPSMGFCLSVALAVEWLAARRFFKVPERTSATALVSALVVAWGAASIAHNRTWDDTLTVFRHCVATDPASAPARSALAGTYHFVGRPREAEIEAKKALELDSKCGNAYINLSYFSYQQGNLDKAIEYLEQARSEIRPDPITRSNLATVHLNLGLLYAGRKDIKRAEENVRRSLELWPRAVGWYYAGQVYFQFGRYHEALDMYQEVVRHVPRSYAPIHFAVALAHEKLGQTAQAQAEYVRYLELAVADSPEVKQAEQRLKQLQSAQPSGGK